MENQDPIHWVGEIEPARLHDAGFDWWRTTGFDFDSRALETLRARASRIELVVFLGIWCPDCQEQLPEFFSLVEAAGISWSSIRLVGTLRDKRALPWTESFGLQRLPTYVILRDGNEIGRITEYPNATLVEDLAEILETRSKGG